MERRRSGFTLIELMIAMGIFAIFIGSAVAALGRMMQMSTAQAQELTIQQNFRFAVDSLTNDARLATNITLLGGTGDSLEMSEEVQFTLLQDGTVHTIRYVAEQVHVGNTSSPWVLRRYDKIGVVQVVQPVTEDMPQLLRVYFINSARQVYVILVGQMTYFDTTREVALVSLVWARNRPPT
jgi:prepilin-type N-terminal cleavage/methylation domain-containing protein